MMALAHNKDLFFLLHQFCYEENLHTTAHMLEQETGCFFDINYFEGLVINGNWDEAENYLSGFTRIKDNEYSLKIYFEMRKHKYYEALDRHDAAGALDILSKDLKVFASVNEGIYKELTLMVTVEDFRKHRSLSWSGDLISWRKNLMNEVKSLIIANPIFHNKLELPRLEKSSLLFLIKKSFELQRVHCAHTQPEPQPSRTMSTATSSLSARAMFCQPSAPPSNIPSNTETHTNMSNQAVSLEHVRNSASSLNGRHCPSMNDKQKNPSFPADLPKVVARCMNMSQALTSMDFHPSNETLLLVGNRAGEIDLWDVSSEVRLFWNAFTIWRGEATSVVILKGLQRDPHVWVNRVLWSPDGSLFGVALSKHIVQLYAYHANANSTQKHLEIDAHNGSVNDLAFSAQEDQLYVITCGDDKLIQVWDAMTGAKQYTFEGHTTSVYSLCAHARHDVDFLFSTSINGEIKAWLFDNCGPKIECIAPHNSCMRMAYTADGERLFSCGTNNAGESFIVEWNESEGYIMQKYHGLSKIAGDIVKFSISKNHFLAAGDEHVIKVWHIDNFELLTIIEAECLPARPYICFNKPGSLLAVFAYNNKIKIFANDAGVHMLQTSARYSLASSARMRNLVINSSAATRVRANNDRVAMVEDSQQERSAETYRLNNGLNSQRRLIAVTASSCRYLKLPSDVQAGKICRLIYNAAGNAIVSLAADGINLIWVWSGFNSSQKGRATTSYAPQLHKRKRGQQMINDLIDNRFLLVSPCFALSKNESYLVSGSGSQISLFNTTTFEKVGSYLPPPPTATCISLYPPDNNIVVVGMDDSTILIYNLKQSKVINRLQGHVKRISGFAFSTKFKELISAGVDTQIIVWDYTNWQKKLSTSLEIFVNWVPSETSETSLQFLQDQTHFLVVHETQLAIYETTKLARVQQWMVGHFSARISHATLSGDNQLVYAVMRSGIILILDAWDLVPTFQIDPSVYVSSNVSRRSYPVVIASNPKKPNQFALGMSDGGVVVIEPQESIGRWMALKQADHGSTN